MDYNRTSDEELVISAKNGDDGAMEELFNRYKGMVKAVSRSYFLVGGDTDDLLQEGMIGVYNAIETFNGSSSFKAYTYKCVKNKIITLIKKSLRHKSLPLNNYVSLSGILDGDMDKTEFVVDDVSDPEEEYINRESEAELKKKIFSLLSRYEKEIFLLYLQGYSYDDISIKTKKKVKSIDNALQRIRKKISTNVLCD